MMMDWIEVAEEGLIATQRIVAVGLAESAPIRRLIQATPPEQVVTITGGRRRQTVLVMDSGHVVITPLTVAELIIWLNGRYS